MPQMCLLSQNFVSSRQPISTKAVIGQVFVLMSVLKHSLLRLCEYFLNTSLLLQFGAV